MKRYRSRSYEPLESDHPGVGNLCPVCNQPLNAGDVPAITWTDENERKGNCVAGDLAHFTCVSDCEEQ